MRTLIACLVSAATLYSAENPVAASAPFIAGHDIHITPSKMVSGSLSPEGRVKLTFPEYLVSDGASQRAKAIISNSFRVPLTRAELLAISTSGVKLAEGKHTFYFDWVQSDRSNEVDSGQAAAITLNPPSRLFASENVVIEVEESEQSSTSDLAMPEGSDVSSEDVLNETLQLPANKSLIILNESVDSPSEGIASRREYRQVSSWRDGAMQWSNGTTLYQHISTLEQQYLFGDQTKVATVGSTLLPTADNENEVASAPPEISFEMLKSETFFSLLLGDAYIYRESVEGETQENGVWAGASMLEELEGRFEKSIRYPVFSFEADGVSFPGYYNGTGPALGSRGTAEVSRFGFANAGQRNIVKQLESRRPIVFFTEGESGRSLIVQHPFARSDQKVKYSIYDGSGEYTVEHVGPTLGVYLLKDATAGEDAQNPSKAPDTGVAPALELQAINLAGRSPFSPRLSLPEKVQALFSQKANARRSSGMMTTMSLLSTSPADRAGLRAEYFADQNLTGTPAFIRTDSTVNFTWGSGSPGAPLTGGLFSVRWRGMVEAAHSQTYTFYTNASDGVRLWVNGQLIINNWTNHSVTENSGSIALVAGKKYNIVMLYYKNSGGNATAQLSWSSSSTPKAIIPSNRLFPPGGSAPVLTSKEFSSGYGFKSGAWTLEPSTKNRPATQGDFTVSTTFTSASLYSAYGPTFVDRKLASGLAANNNQTGQSQSLTITVTGDWAGNIPGGSNYQTSLIIDSIKIRGVKYEAGSGSFSWTETTPGHTGSSTAVSLQSAGGSLTNLLNAGKYNDLEWNPSDFPAAGTSMARTFTITTTGATNIPLDGLEIVARVRVTSDPPALESSPFSFGYGYSTDSVDPNGAKWKLETSALNTPVTQGDFTITPQFASQPAYSAYGPLFTSRTLVNGPAGGNGRSANSGSLAITVNANWTGSIPNTANHRISLVIESIKVRGVKWIGSASSGPLVKLSIVETTPNHASGSSFVDLQNTGNPLSNLADALKYNTVTWDPVDYYVDGTSTSRTFTVVADDGLAIPVDGIEIEARVVVGFDNDAWNTSFEQGLADWNVLPITVSSPVSGRVDSADVNGNRVVDGERSLQLVADNYSPQIKVVSTMQPLLPNAPYQQFSYQYFYEHLQRPGGVPPDDYLDREFGGKLKLYDSTGAAIPNGEIDRPGGYISDGNWFPAVIQAEIPANASFYTLEFYWKARTGKVAFDDIRHTPIAYAPVATQTGVKLSYSDASRDLWVASPLEKIYQDVPIPPSSPAATRIQMSAAQREAQSIQLVYRPKVAEAFSVSIGNLTGPGGQTIAASNVSIRYVDYFDITVTSPDDTQPGDVHPSTFGRLGVTPDPLRPTSPGSVAANVSQPIWITVTVPASTPPGIYTGTVALVTGGVSKNIPIDVEVFGFAIPEKPHMKIMASNAAPAIRNQLRERLKAHRIFSEMGFGTNGTSGLPVTINSSNQAVIDWTAWDAAMDKYVNDDGMTYFVVPQMQIGTIVGAGYNGYWMNNPNLLLGTPNWEAALADYVDQVWQHLGSLGIQNYAIWKIWDEPFKTEFAAEAALVAKIVRENAPGAKICVTSWPQPALYDSPVNIWLQPRPTYVPELPTPATESNESWIYHNDLFLVDRPFGLTDMRNNAWWMWKNDVKGILWWNVTYGWGTGGYYMNDQDPYEGQDGGGFLFYPGGSTSVVHDSMRIAAFRDSVDDYDYFTILRSAQDARKTALGIAVAPSGRTLVQSLIDGVEGKNDPKAIERSRFLAARLITFLGNSAVPAVFDLDEDYLALHQLKGYVATGTTITNGGIAVPLGPGNSFTVDFRLPTVFTKSGVPYNLQDAP